MFLITVPAVDWSVTIWFERNLGFFPAICTSYIVHLTRCAIVPTTTIGSFSFFHYYILPFYISVLRFLRTAGLPYRDEVFNFIAETSSIEREKLFITFKC